VHLGRQGAHGEGKVVRNGVGRFYAEGSRYRTERRKEEGPRSSGAWDPQPSGTCNRGGPAGMAATTLSSGNR
jgi:hypothetical protein